MNRIEKEEMLDASFTGLWDIFAEFRNHYAFRNGLIEDNNDVNEINTLMVIINE